MSTNDGEPDSEFVVTDPESAKWGDPIHSALGFALFVAVLHIPAYAFYLNGRLTLSAILALSPFLVLVKAYREYKLDREGPFRRFVLRGWLMGASVVMTADACSALAA